MAVGATCVCVLPLHRRIWGPIGALVRFALRNRNSNFSGDSLRTQRVAVPPRGKERGLSREARDGPHTHIHTHTHLRAEPWVLSRGWERGSWWSGHGVLSSCRLFPNSPLKPRSQEPSAHGRSTEPALTMNKSLSGGTASLWHAASSSLGFLSMLPCSTAPYPLLPSLTFLYDRV